ncbi:kynureninase [Shouchella clausii]|uniref:kynureninase n=1 Tax=Shouchella clausii TaxID=79880 RepID=UPI000BA5F283|nr:kynureninase [Shouchella clausii]MBU8596155.1 kynureninase [Shouchella clausii]PAD09754.1 kynureninase [Shouchella clausii]PAE84734.1 kynureninase [Shouchella clausii]PAF05952.1 kynureninase [Shouchella clausii]
MPCFESVYTKEYAQQLDAADPLARFRNEFYIDKKSIYLDGNSLGLLSIRAEQSLLDVLDSWKQYGIDGWTKGKHPWFYLSESLGEKMAFLVGAKAEEVIVTGSTTTNLHQLVSSFFRPEGKKTKILADELNFPSDIYALKSQLHLRGLDPEEHLIQVKSENGHILNEGDIIAKMKEDVALIVLPSVLYRSGQILDMERLTTAAHQRNILIGFDLCHSIGSIPHQLGKWDVDFAFWCTYKHVNGGPGSVAALFVNEKHFGRSPGLAGWFSSNKQKQFDMEHTLTHAEHAGAFQIGTPHIFSIAPLIGSLAIFAEAGIDQIRKKSLKLTDYMMTLIEHELSEYQFTIQNPRDERRGGHLYIEHEEAARICKALKEENVIPDFRSPKGIRLAPVALYNTFEEVWNSIQVLKLIMKEERYKKLKNERDVVA